MKKFLFYIVIVTLAVAINTHAEMKLKLSSAITGDTPQSIVNNDLTSNLKLEVPNNVSTLANMKDFVKGMILLGIFADVTIPFGDENGFKHIAGTGFSGHVMAAYVISATLLLRLTAGYIKYGTKTSTEDLGFGDTWKFEDKYSQIPILLGLYYLINTHSAFRPYIGLALGLIIQSYTFTGTWSYAIGGQTYSGTEKADKSSAGFGIAPSVGFYYILGSVIIGLAVEYLHMISKLELSSSDYTSTGGLGKTNGSLRITQDGADYTESYSAKSLSINFGVAFPLNIK